MSTPCFADFDKVASDLFDQDFVAGRLDLSLLTRANNGAEFAVSGTGHRRDSGDVTTFGSLETRLQCKDHGLTVMEKWDTDNVLTSNVSVVDRPVSGMTSSLETTFLPATGQKGLQVNMSMERRRMHTTVEADLDLACRAVRASSAFRLDNLLVGGRFVFEPQAQGRRVTDGAVGMAYQGTDFTFNASLTNGTRCAASVHHRLAPHLQWGVLCGFNFNMPGANMAVAMRRQIDRSSFWKAKVDNEGQCSVSYGHKLTDDLQATLSAEVNIKGGSAAPHRLGLAIEFEP